MFPTQHLGSKFSMSLLTSASVNLSGNWWVATVIPSFNLIADCGRSAEAADRR